MGYNGKEKSTVQNENLDEDSRDNKNSSNEWSIFANQYKHAHSCPELAFYTERKGRTKYLLF